MRQNPWQPKSKSCPNYRDHLTSDVRDSEQFSSRELAVIWSERTVTITFTRGVGPKPDGSQREEESNTHKYRGLASNKKVCKAFTLKWAQLGLSADRLDWMEGAIGQRVSFELGAARSANRGRIADLPKNRHNRTIQFEIFDSVGAVFRGRSNGPSAQSYWGHLWGQLFYRNSQS